MKRSFRKEPLVMLLPALLAAMAAVAHDRPGKNFVRIAPGEGEGAIVAKAARVVPSPNQYAWQKREFIAFAHFGINTFTDREWGEGSEDPGIFYPSAFDPRQWISVLKAAGARMLILTAKHHDGFCLWPSKLTRHSVRSSPWRNGQGDVVREAAQACREAGLGFGIYLSPWDRHEPSYGDSPRYNEFFRGQLRELLTNYGEIAEVWFDGACGEGPNGKRQVYDWPSYYRVVRELQPKAVIFGMGPDVRWVGTESGVGRETEWSVVPLPVRGGHSAAMKGRHPLDSVFAPGDMTAADLGSRDKIRGAALLAWYPAETDVSIRPGWFHHPAEDGRVKTPQELVDIYFNSVGRNGVLLLNIPPDRRGLIHESDARSLAGMKQILDSCFSRNFAAGAAATDSSAQQGHPAAAVCDGSEETYWFAGGKTGPAVIELELKEESTFDAAMLMENIRVGQRIESFRLEWWNGAGWERFAAGTTVGYKRLLRFPAVTARRIRITIAQSRAEPTLAAFGLFKLPPAIESGKVS